MEEGYIDTLIAINKNLRDQLEITYKLLKLKIKTEPSEKINRLDILINELEILKTSLTFSLQKQAEIVRNLRNFDNSNLHNINLNLNKKIEEFEIIDDALKKENLELKDKINNYEINLNNLNLNFEDKCNEIKIYNNEINEYKHLIEEEKIKSKNLVNLIKDLEKKKSSEKLEKESKLLKDQIELLTIKLKEFENKFKIKLENKDSIIAKLDSKLSEYENLLHNK